MSDPTVAGVHTWRYRTDADDVRLQLLIQPQIKLAVSLWWNNPSSREDALFWLPHRSRGVEFGDLTGTQYGTPLHGIGVGVLLVNTAVQAIKLLYPSDTAVFGILSNPSDDRYDAQLKHRLAERRRGFWQQFGLQTGPGLYERLYGTVRELRCVEHGLVKGLFPRYVPLDNFSFNPHDGRRDR